MGYFGAPYNCNNPEAIPDPRGISRRRCAPVFLKKATYFVFQIPSAQSSNRRARLRELRPYPTGRLFWVAHLSQALRARLRSQLLRDEEPPSPQKGTVFAGAIFRNLFQQGESVTEEQKELVQTSFGKVIPISDAAAVLFYDQLFALDPSLRGLFKSDMAEQRAKLMAMLTTAVRSLGRRETLVPVLRELGRRHIGYGVKPDHYETVGAALLATLEKGLGQDFTPPVREAWVVCYTSIAREMLEGTGHKAALP
jgi:hemoglobin-like flavoprotein